MKLKLGIESVPISAWGRSLANLLPRREWDDLRMQCYREANYKCEICGNTTLDLEAHEVWRFDDKRAIMALAYIQCLCKLCHGVKHYGRSKVVDGKRYAKILIEHWCSINDKTQADFAQHEAEVFKLNKKRADIYYQVRVGRRILA
jgi:hypothetical protein